MKNQLDIVIAAMCQGRVPYDEAVREFKRTFITTVLREQRGNQVKTARELHMHRNTLSRTIADLELDLNALGFTTLRRPPRSERNIR